MSTLAFNKLIICVMDYLRKFKGSKVSPKVPPRPNFQILISSFVGAFLGISAAVGISQYTILKGSEESIPIVMGSVGAMAILTYGAIEVPLAQPRNLVLGNLFSALVGVLTQFIFEKVTKDPDSFIWLKSGLSVAFSLVIMQLTRTVHPPAGATALIAVTGGQRIYSLSFLYLLIPVLYSTIILLVVGLFTNNVIRQYPTYWFNPDLKIKNELSFLLKKEKQNAEPIALSKTDLNIQLDSQFDFNLNSYSMIKEELNLAKQRVKDLEGMLESITPLSSNV